MSETTPNPRYRLEEAIVRGLKNWAASEEAATGGPVPFIAESVEESLMEGAQAALDQLNAMLPEMLAARRQGD